LSAISADDVSSQMTHTLNSFGLLLYTMNLFQTLKTSQETMKEVKNYYASEEQSKS
jgi:hypothetical protein